MNKTLVWLGILVVIVIVVVVVAKRSGREEAGGAAAKGSAAGLPSLEPEMERGNTTYDILAADVANAGTPLGRHYVLQEYFKWVVTGKGTVVSATEEEGGGWFVEIDVDPAADDGAEVWVEVPLPNTKGRQLPGVGEEVRFKGQIDKPYADGTDLQLDLIRGIVGK